MKISGKHSVEEINGIRCSLIEKDVSRERADFLQAVLEHNGYQVLIQKIIPPPPKPAKPGAEPPPPAPASPETFKVGVTDISFNVAVMIFSRKLKTPGDKVLLPTYWTQEDAGYEGWYWKWEKKGT